MTFLARLLVNVRFEFNLLLLALSFFTRIPVPSSMHYSPALLNKANRYFSLVGLLLGCLLGLSYVVLNSFFPISVAVLSTMVIGLLLTGAFHEDGLADMADGIGGAFTVGKRLVIMKDSRIGTYGSVTLLMALFLKFSLLVELANIAEYYLVIAFIISFPLSRALAGSLISSLPYVSDEQSSKSKPIAQAQSGGECFVLVAIATLPLLLLPLTASITLILLLIVFQLLFKRWLIAKLGGFTGDCLGAAQQLSELLIYFFLLAYWSTAQGTVL